MNPAHLKITVRNETGGGQQTCLCQTGVWIEHLPTGLKAFCDQERSQLKNKRVAMLMVEYGLAEIGWVEPDVLPGLDLPPPEKKTTPARRRNPVFDALAVVGGAKLEELTRSAAGAVAEALKQIIAATPGVTAEEITARAARYRMLHPQWELTPTALAKHWASLGIQQQARSGLYANSVRPD